MAELKPCPFCGGEAGLFEIKGMDNDLAGYMIDCICEGGRRGSMRCKYEGSGVWDGRCMGTKEVDPCAGYDKCERFKPDYKTNADHIRSMTDEELCEFLYSYKFCDMCEEGCGECRYHGDCERRLADWLKQPYKEEP